MRRRPATSRPRGAIQFELLPLMQALFLEVNPIRLKAALAIAGQDPERAAPAAHADDRKQPAERLEQVAARAVGTLG